MAEHESRRWRPLANFWFVTGVVFGLLAVAPKIMLQFGIVLGNYGETWAMLPGFVAWWAMFVGSWYFDGRFVYPAIAVGVLANGLLYAGVGFVIRAMKRPAGTVETRKLASKGETKESIADLIERFLDGRTGAYEWDDFESVPLKDPELDAIREECATIWRRYPAERKGVFCSEEGFTELRRIAAKLRQTP